MHGSPQEPYLSMLERALEDLTEHDKIDSTFQRQHWRLVPQARPHDESSDSITLCSGSALMQTSALLIARARNPGQAFLPAERKSHFVAVPGCGVDESCPACTLAMSNCILSIRSDQLNGTSERGKRAGSSV